MGLDKKQVREDLETAKNYIPALILALTVIILATASTILTINNTEVADDIVVKIMLTLIFSAIYSYFILTGYFLHGFLKSVHDRYTTDEK